MGLKTICSWSGNDAVAECDTAGGMSSRSELKSLAAGLLEEWQKLSPKTVGAVRSACKDYMDRVEGDDGGQAAAALVGMLKEREYLHPMRAALLYYGLRGDVWSSKPSFFGSTSTGTRFDFSHDSERCSCFVSHAWNDPGNRKLKMLREFLFLQSFVGSATVLLIVIAAVITPLGFALAEPVYIDLGILQMQTADMTYWWIIPVVPVGLLALLLLWVTLSLAGLIPSTLAPWALSATTVWIDKLCINQENNVTKAAGVAGFERFLGKCDRMIAFIGPTYFSRLWCVYELATFTRMHGMHEVDAPSGKLMLLLLDWPSSMYPFKQTDVSEEEMKSITSFSCREAACFKAEDRAFVLAEIRKKFGSEEEFDKFVRSHLPAVLMRSKNEFSTKMMSVAAEILDLVFG